MPRFPGLWVTCYTEGEEQVAGETDAGETTMADWRG